MRGTRIVVGVFICFVLSGCYHGILVHEDRMWGLAQLMLEEHQKKKDKTYISEPPLWITQR